MNFLSPDTKQIRHSIRDIDDSYNNQWDIIAELCQNSVDAVRKSSSDTGLISIEVDCIKKSISIFDNGIGISPEVLPDLLKPFSSAKSDDDTTIGEKGVGLTFTLFACNDFYIKSGNANGVSSGCIKYAFDWKNRTDNSILELQHQILPNDSFQGTEIKLNQVTTNCALFDLTCAQFYYVLRTKTAIGNTLSIWDKDCNISVSLKFTDSNGNFTEQMVPFKYLEITEATGQNDFIDLDDFIKFASHPDTTDQDKRRKLQDKIVVLKDQVLHNNNRPIKYKAYYVPSRVDWESISIHQKLCTKENLEDISWRDNFSYLLFHSGITASVKGMPTAISIEPPSTGAMGYWSNMFIIFEDKHIRFDIGRKSIHGQQSRIYKQYAKDIFNKLTRFVTKYTSGNISETPEWERDSIFAELDSLLDINYSNTNFSKSPKDQEAAVAAIFYECIGNGSIKDICPITSGYRNKYDLYAKWGKRNVVIEFKSQLSKILKDFTDQQKLFNEIDAIVCWDVTEADEKSFKDKGLRIEKIENSGILRTKSKSENFPHGTHLLLLSGLTKPIYVVDLKTHLNETNSNKK